jgi:CP family cyanate transporter-like MFS transporter
VPKGLSLGVAAYLVAMIVFASFNLRPGLVTIGPVLPQVGRSLGLGSIALGVLTSLPILALGIFSWIADPIGRRIGWSLGVVLAELFVAIGIVVRSLGVDWTAFVGATVIGAGVGLGGVYVPALVKANFPTRLGPLMGVYTMTLTLGSMASVAVTPALLHTFGGAWQPALGVWTLPAAAAALLWIPLRRVSSAAATGATRVSLWRNALAWVVAINMGLQSTLFYSLVSWLAVLLQGRGESVAQSGVDLSWFYGPMLFGGLLGPMLLGRTRYQGPSALAWGALSGVGLFGALYAPRSLIGPFCALDGFALGGIFGVALSFLVLRAREPQSAAALSSMAQTVGYIIASIGPFALGALRTLPDAETSSVAFLLFLTILTMVFGLLAGRPLYVEDRRAFTEGKTSPAR